MKYSYSDKTMIGMKSKYDYHEENKEEYYNERRYEDRNVDWTAKCYGRSTDYSSRIK